MERMEELFRQNPNLERLLRPNADELAGLSESIRTLREDLERAPESLEVVFQLGAALVSHSRKSFIEEGLNLMQTLVCTRWQSNWSKMKNMENDRDYKAFECSEGAVPRGVTLSVPTAPPDSDSDRDMELGESVPVVSSSTSEDGDGGSEGLPPLHLKLAAPSSIAPAQMDDLALYHYYLGLGWIKLDELSRARNCVQQMLLLAPYNKQGRALMEYIKVAERRGTAATTAQAVAGLGFLFGAAALVGAAFSKRS
ncbi:hypothetical protein STCU_00328 [Strigomonas culicis]|uniref:Mitochondrial fission 1 protein n=1 Tax=Strigomonas culicis TaxID=28005 RepID=S9V7C0_9TRYP|nr:hypothetical protein STCU_00328 [Strigomonas culicis]|eukprot:EPY36944.1 hypothetical protein STCU_00328 [Strigomonas culicis]